MDRTKEIPKVKVRNCGIYRAERTLPDGLYVVYNIEGEFETNRIIEGFIFDYDGNLVSGFHVYESGFTKEVGYLQGSKRLKYNLKLEIPLEEANAFRVMDELAYD